jgi:hypothetical protein
MPLRRALPSDKVAAIFGIFSATFFWFRNVRPDAEWNMGNSFWITFIGVYCLHAHAFWVWRDTRGASDTSGVNFLAPLHSVHTITIAR